MTNMIYGFLLKCPRRATKNETPRNSTSGTLREGVRAMYTDYGYSLDGIEYATVDEAYEDDETE